MSTTLTQQRLHELLHYDPSTGAFTWRVAPNRRIIAGSVAGVTETNGYRRIRIDGRQYGAHRLAWLYMHGEFPPNDIDHINRTRDDNRSTNLRAVTRKENMTNVAPRRRLTEVACHA
jgi:hypothetical protein